MCALVTGVQTCALPISQEREADTDLDAPRILREPPAADQGLTQAVLGIARSSSADSDPGRVVFGGEAFVATAEIGRASCRERVCKYVSISVFAVSSKKTYHSLKVKL